MITLLHIQTALQLPDFDSTAAQNLMSPPSRAPQRPSTLTGQARLGAVLLLLYCHKATIQLLLTRRRDDLNTHAGQISFPGGRQEGDEPFATTALRETEEEVGVAPTAVTLLGSLQPIWIPPSDFLVHPFVGWVHSGQRPSFAPSASEVAALLEVPLPHLLDRANHKVGLIERPNYRLTVPYFEVEGQMVWGATAVMLSEFVERLRWVLENESATTDLRQ